MKRRQLRKCSIMREATMKDGYDLPAIME